MVKSGWENERRLPFLARADWLIAAAPGRAWWKKRGAWPWGSAALCALVDRISTEWERESQVGGDRDGVGWMDGELVVFDLLLPPLL